MTSKTVSMLDRAGHFGGTTEADESPLEPGHYLLPANTIDSLPPHEAAEGKRWRHNGSAWEEITHRPPTPPSEDPALIKLRQFLLTNPDVAALLG